MKPRHCLSPLLNVAAILFLLLRWSNSCAHDLSTQPPGAAATARTPTSDLVSCSPDGEFYAVASPNGRIKYGRTQDGAASRTFYQCHPLAMVFSADGRFLAVAPGSNGCPARLKVWNVDDGSLLCRMESKAGTAALLSFSPDGLLLASTSGDTRVNVWRLPQGTLKYSVTTSQPIARIAFSDEGRAVVAVCAGGSVQHFSVP